MDIIALKTTIRIKEAILGHVIGYKKAFFTQLTGALPGSVKNLSHICLG